MKPFFEGDGITLYCGDAIDILPRLELQVDAVVTDPPYNETSLEWDVWPKGWPSMVARFARSLWCFGSLRMFWDRVGEFEEWKLAQEIVWEKHNGSSLHADRFRRVHELAVHFYRGEWGTLHRKVPVEIVPAREQRKLLRSSKPQHFGDSDKGGGYVYDGTRLMRSVIPVRSCHGYAVNETQKPEGIVSPLLEYAVPPGGVVLDPFAGSGTTLAVARSQGKRAIGIEKRASQCREIVRRLAQGDLFSIAPTVEAGQRPAHPAGEEGRA